VTLSIANHHASLPIGYRLYLPQEWAKNAARRKKARIPKEISFIIVDIWSSVMPGRIGAKSGTEAQKAREQHPVAYWVGRILMMTIGAWIVTVAIMGSWN
jgi:hypothetical protein